MTSPYADSAALAAWLGTAAPADADRLLERASLLLDSVLVSTFEVDGDGLPVDADVAQACSDAACAQVEYWLSQGEGVDVTAGTFSGGFSVGNLRIDGVNAASGLAPRARRALATRSLLVGAHVA